MLHTIFLSLSLTAFWLLISGHYNTLTLALGATSVGFTLFIAHRMDVVDHEAQPLHFTLKFLHYQLWLIKEIIVANITVVKHVWLGNDSISPTMTTITANQKTDVGKVIYANSITLTPGTVTVNLDGDQFTVHALLKESIDDLQSGEMDRRVTEME